MCTIRDVVLWLTMIFAIPSDAETPCFDCGKTQANSLAQSGRVDVRNPVLVTDSTVREIKALTRHIAIGIRSIVRSEPVVSE